MSLHQYKIPTLKDKIQSQAMAVAANAPVADSKDEGVKDEVKSVGNESVAVEGEVKVEKVRKGRRLNK